MYCPYCKNKLIKINDEYYCKTGDCYFSKNLSNEFDKSYITYNNTKYLNDIGQLYCVKCGKELFKDNDIEYCNECSFFIDNKLRYNIVEFNSHKYLNVNINKLYNYIINIKNTNLKIEYQKNSYFGYIDIFTSIYAGRITINNNGLIDKEIISIETYKQIYYDISVYYEIGKFLSSINAFLSLFK